MNRRKEELERIRDLPDHELHQALIRVQDELFRLKMKHATNQVENPLLIREKRREIARVQTIISSRKLGKEVQAQGSEQ